MGKKPDENDSPPDSDAEDVAEKGRKGRDEEEGEEEDEEHDEDNEEKGEGEEEEEDEGAELSGGDEGDGGAFGCMAVTRLSLRAAEFVLSLICFSLIASAQGVSGGWVLRLYSLQFLLAMGVIVCVYAVAAAVLLTLALVNPDTDLTYQLPRPLLVVDFVLLALMFGAACAAAPVYNATTTSCVSAYKNTILRNFTSPCPLIGGGISMGFLTSFCLMADFWLTLIPVFVEL